MSFKLYNKPETHEEPELIEYKLVDWATLAPTLYELEDDPNTCKLIYYIHCLI